METAYLEEYRQQSGCGEDGRVDWKRSKITNIHDYILFFIGTTFRHETFAPPSFAIEELMKLNSFYSFISQNWLISPTLPLLPAASIVIDPHAPSLSTYHSPSHFTLSLPVSV